LRIVDADMKEAPHDRATSGEIVVRAPWLTNSYYTSPEASEHLWAGGYLHTGDIGVITPGGDLQGPPRGLAGSELLRSARVWRSRSTNAICRFPVHLGR
jgi:acyl-CoA synthetase (AMP-forming)/AMP-acid ligase II